VKKILLFTLFLFTFLGKAQNNDSILLELDKTIEQSNIYESKTRRSISNLLELLNHSSSLEKKYVYNNALANAYIVFKSDSAKIFALNTLNLAKQLNDEPRINESKILFASIDAKAGMFPLAVDMLNGIDIKKLTKNQLIHYYKTYSEILIYWMEYMEGQDVTELSVKRNVIRDALIEILPKNSVEYAINLGTKDIEYKKYNEAEEILLRNFKYAKKGTRDYSVYTAILAYLYETKKEKEKQKYYLALSAISDLKCSIKENLSLRSLAMKLYEEGDLNRANFYIKKSLQDANFYNARLRSIQISKILPIIDQAYMIKKQKQEEKLRFLLIVLSIVSIILLLAIYYIFKQMKKISKARLELAEINKKLNVLNDELKAANEKERKMNLNLYEANITKEQYIHSFLEICTEYIQRLESFKSIVNRKIKTGQTAEILKFTSSDKGDTKELKELYKNFDKAFLNVYPHFEKEVNKLLKPDERYILKEDKTMNQELRIYALIRLGITDNNQIATFLHYTLRTVYNYRSRVKLKAYHPENFENEILEIGLLITKENN
jgi:competence protein ComGC